MPDVNVDPVDFPQVWQRPTFEDLLACLKQLRIQPSVWNPSSAPTALTRENTARSRREIASYLSSIVSNGLSWLEDDERKEVIWDEAGRCLSERCGRAAMGEIVRRWPFENREHAFELTIREPPITGENLGYKTWGSSYLLAQLLDDIAAGPLSHLIGTNGSGSANILELGSGTGLLGMAAAVMWQSKVVLTDLPAILTNLEFNIEQNRDTVEALGGQVSAGALTWGAEDGNDTQFDEPNQFDIILAADGIYDDDHPVQLSSAIHLHLRRSPLSRVLIMTPIRDQITTQLISQFKSNMASGSFPSLPLEEHRIAGQDDWGEDGESQSVECWWAIFGSPVR